MKFSDRMGFTTPVTIVQIDGMTHELRNSLWNLIREVYGDSESVWDQVVRYSARFYFKVPVDSLSDYHHERVAWFRKRFLGDDWAETYNIFEFVVRNHRRASMSVGGFGEPESHHVTPREFMDAANAILLREGSGYRFIDGLLAPIADQVEVDEVQQAASDLSAVGLGGAQTHIRTALELFSKRPNPDYRNAVKEAISAVESIAKAVGDSEGDGLAGPLRALRDKAGLHGALSQAFEKLYGYTSDKDGIRHAMLTATEVPFEEAKYMIVACSAFVNYMAAKADKAGLLKKG